MTGVLLLIGSYLLGSIPSGLWLVRTLRGVDVRDHGSRNIGVANVYRVAGPAVGALVLAADAWKGGLPVLIARWLFPDPGWAVLAGLVAIAGHNWSIFLGFRGGKGIATSFGVLLALSPLAALVAAAVWIVTVAATKYASLGSLLGLLSLPVTMAARGAPAEHFGFALIAIVFGFYQHRANILRLLSGTENRITDRPRSRA
ncbi:MAG: glycerol-3-phosphate 1-O-acyltransferase PlsY [Armatimonadetes bacterium]|nr:glycerol-3-phosphate 1-O-acyltransferase PlsY [Armatimonadota bacterium]